MLIDSPHMTGILKSKVGATAMHQKKCDVRFDHPPTRPATAQCPLIIYLQRQGSHAVIGLCGSLGIGQVDPLQAVLRTLAEDDVRLVVLDLHDLDFIGSAGLAAIVSGYLQVCGYQQSHQRQGRIKLVAPQPAVLDVIERTRLTKLFPVCDSVEQAFAQSA